MPQCTVAQVRSGTTDELTKWRVFHTALYTSQLTRHLVTFALALALVRLWPPPQGAGQLTAAIAMPVVTSTDASTYNATAAVLLTVQQAYYSSGPTTVTVLTSGCYAAAFLPTRKQVIVACAVLGAAVLALVARVCCCTTSNQSNRWGSTLLGVISGVTAAPAVWCTVQLVGLPACLRLPDLDGTVPWVVCGGSIVSAFLVAFSLHWLVPTSKGPLLLAYAVVPLLALTLCGVQLLVGVLEAADRSLAIDVLEAMLHRNRQVLLPVALLGSRLFLYSLLTALPWWPSGTGCIKSFMVLWQALLSGGTAVGALVLAANTQLWPGYCRLVVWAAAGGIPAFGLDQLLVANLRRVAATGSPEGLAFARRVPLALSSCITRRSRFIVMHYWAFVFLLLGCAGGGLAWAAVGSAADRLLPAAVRIVLSALGCVLLLALLCADLYGYAVLLWLHSGWKARVAATSDTGEATTLRVRMPCASWLGVWTVSGPSEASCSATPQRHSVCVHVKFTSRPRYSCVKLDLKCDRRAAGYALVGSLELAVVPGAVHRMELVSPVGDLTEGEPAEIKVRLYDRSGWELNGDLPAAADFQLYDPSGERETVLTNKEGDVAFTPSVPGTHSLRVGGAEVPLVVARNFSPRLVLDSVDAIRAGTTFKLKLYPNPRTPGPVATADVNVSCDCDHARYSLKVENRTDDPSLAHFEIQMNARQSGSFDVAATVAGKRTALSLEVLPARVDPARCSVNVASKLVADGKPRRAVIVVSFVDEFLNVSSLSEEAIHDLGFSIVEIGGEPVSAVMSVAPQGSAVEMSFVPKADRYTLTFGGRSVNVDLNGIADLQAQVEACTTSEDSVSVGCSMVPLFPHLERRTPVTVSCVFSQSGASDVVRLDSRFEDGKQHVTFRTVLPPGRWEAKCTAAGRIAACQVVVADPSPSDFPPYWIREPIGQQEECRCFLVDEMKAPLQEVLRQTSCHSCPKPTGAAVVVSVHRLENRPLWRLFQARYHLLASQFRTDGIPVPRLDPPINPTLARLKPAMPGNSFDLNCFYLLHGTKSAGDIIKAGLSEKWAAESSLYGRGVYFAEQACKSNQYTRNGAGLHEILVCRVVLGNPYYTKKSDGEKGCIAPPLICGKKVHHTSTIANPGKARDGVQSHREFVIFEGAQCYPEFLVRYTETKD